MCCFTLVAGIERNLAAASLSTWEIDLNTRAVQDFDGRFADLGEEQICHARDKERDSHAIPFQDL